MILRKWSKYIWYIFIYIYVYICQFDSSWFYCSWWIPILPRFKGSCCKSGRVPGGGPSPSGESWTVMDFLHEKTRSTYFFVTHMWKHEQVGNHEEKIMIESYYHVLTSGHFELTIESKTFVFMLFMSLFCRQRSQHDDIWQNHSELGHILVRTSAPGLCRADESLWKSTRLRGEVNNPRDFQSHFQCLFLVPVKDGMWHILNWQYIPLLYTTYSPCLRLGVF